MSLRVGDELPEVLTPAIDRLRIAYMAVSMRDPNLVHVEDSYAAKSGLPSVIAHGTFVTSYAGAAVSRAVGVDAVRRIRVDVTAPVFPGDVLRTQAVVTGADPAADGQLLTIDVTVTNQDGVRVGRGTATVEQPAA
ncbi:Acyl dehydratase [Blastococcus aggregatus]|uniref:Acyl dehydratase n=1 Tax=Blastococcus aggregatus TaxID=38502 RepID=A0A285V331_9ACTN|nr:MaoC/PaaZ C-terminal domain-containing protein [Blastococcus aggregatus]SOC48565.1 Acyl dehydratase [Blastococcus aggregatus]